jgi:hypothetical protein
MQFDANGEQIKPPKWPGVEGAPAPSPHDMEHMTQISKLIADLQQIKDRFGDTCVYIRRHGLSWGAVALNYQSDDEKNGVFDLQARHDRDMLARLEQIERLKADRDSWMEAANFDRSSKTKLPNPPMENSGDTGNARAAPAMTGNLPVAGAPTTSTVNK